MQFGGGGETLGIMLQPDNGRAGSFVAERNPWHERILPTFVNFNCANATLTVQQQRPTEDTNASQQKPGRRFVLAKPVSSSSGGDLIRVVTGPDQMAACAVRLIAPLSLFHIGLIGPVSRLFWINPDRAFQDPNRRSENTGLH